VSAARSCSSSSGVSFSWLRIELRIAVRRSSRLRSAGQQLHDGANLLFVQPAGSLFAIAGDEGQCVAGVNQLDGGGHLLDWQAELGGDARCGWFNHQVTSLLRELVFYA
jgi:hypothetical protein